MVRALLEGRKTQTRRVVKDQPPPCKGFPHMHPDGSWGIYLDQPNGGPYKHIGKCPYGSPGHLLWVRETWQTAMSDDGPCLLYRADKGRWYPEYTGPNEGIGPSFDYERYPGDYVEWAGDVERRGPWKSPIHMPRWASRLTLEITDVRVERLQSLSEEDAIAEGVFFTDYGRRCFHEGQGNPSTCPASVEHHPLKPGWMWKPTLSSDECLGSARHAYANLWNTINGPSSWQASPWIWALTFKVHQQNTDHRTEIPED